MIADTYHEFLTDMLESARRWGPHNPAVVRRLELGTTRYLLEPARQLEAETTDTATLEGERRKVQETLRSVWDRGLFGYEITHWPSGPGSSRAMELIYGNNPLAYDVAAHYTEAFLLSRDLAHAVRSRRDVLRDLLTSELNGRNGTVAMLDLACGPCQSLREALPLLRQPQRVQLRAVDTDELSQINNRGYFQRGHQLPWEFEIGNVLKTDFGQNTNDLVYSTGLYDYIPSKPLSELWRRVYASLKPGGLALLSVKDGANFCPLFYRWAINWSQFYIRVEADFQQIMRDAELPAPEAMVRDATGCIIFYLVRKPR